MNPTLDTGLFARKRIRPLRQTEVAECALACLAMVASYHGLRIDLTKLRREFPPSSRGTSLRSLIKIADDLGFATRALRVEPDGLPGLRLPAILHWGLSHFVVLERVRRKRALVHDPARGSRWVPFEQIEKYFSGVALELMPTSRFVPAELRHRAKLSQLWSSSSGLGSTFAQTLLLSLLLQLYILISPYYLQLVVDAAIPAGDKAFLAALALGFGLFALFHGVAALLRSFVLLTGGVQLAFTLSVNVARHMFRLPLRWFESRQTGDILSRYQSVGPIQQAITVGPVAALLDGVLALTTLVLMLWYSIWLSLLAATALVAYSLVRLAMLSNQRTAQEDALVSLAKSQTHMIDSLRGITTLRLSGREAERISQWQGSLINSMNDAAQVQRIQAWQETLKLSLLSVEGVLSLWLAANLVIDDQMTIGMLFALMAYKLQFLTRSIALVDQAFLFGMLSIHLDRLGDVTTSEQDRSFTDSRVAFRELAGRIELADIMFRYGASEPFILNRVSLRIDPGDHIVITGPSGGGKTTLVKLIMGLIEPEAGEVIVDGQSLDRFGLRHFRDQVAAVLQDDALFEGTLTGNIALFEDQPDLERVKLAAIQASIYDEIIAMPMGFETMVGDMGSSLSGGQKQRVLLARALYRAPKVLVLDEGTAHLDPENEARVNRSISALGITRIVVAHRRETIRQARRVYRLEGGRLEECTLDHHQADRSEVSAEASRTHSAANGDSDTD